MLEKIREFEKTNPEAAKVLAKFASKWMDQKNLAEAQGMLRGQSSPSAELPRAERDKILLQAELALLAISGQSEDIIEP